MTDDPETHERLLLAEHETHCVTCSLGFHSSCPEGVEMLFDALESEVCPYLEPVRRPPVRVVSEPAFAEVDEMGGGQ